MESTFLLPFRDIFNPKQLMSMNYALQQSKTALAQTLYDNHTILLR
jgi:hypothetical protein